MKRKILFPLIGFMAISLLHLLYYIWKLSQISQQWVQTEPISPISLYFSRQDFLLGFSYALAGGFTIYAILSFLHNRAQGLTGLAGGLTLTGLLYISGCFLLGCCGSPMLTVYLSLFGSSFLGFAKPLIAIITTASVIIGFFWIEKTSKKYCVKTQGCCPTKAVEKKGNEIC